MKHDTSIQALYNIVDSFFCGTLFFKCADRSVCYLPLATHHCGAGSLHLGDPSILMQSLYTVYIVALERNIEL